MQSEYFDKKIKEAAEHHHPAYDEKAWDKMEKLLDKHMPTEKDNRRRIFFFLLLFLAIALTGGGIYYLKTNQTKDNKVGLTNKINNEPAKGSVEKTPDASVKKTEDESLQKINPVADKPSAITDQSSSTTEKPSSSTNNAETPQTNDREIKKNDNLIAAGKSSVNSKRTNNNIRYKAITAKGQPGLSAAHKKAPGIFNTKTKQNRDNTDIAIGNNATDKDINEPATGKIITTPGNTNSSVSNADNNIVSDKPGNKDSVLQKQVADTAKKEDKNNIAAQPRQSPKPGKQKKSAFAVTFSTMPDLSTVGISRAGKVKLGYGAGLSYTLNRFTIRSGFYVGKKVYTAGPDDYHPPKHNWIYYVDLSKVEADCKVYEIPVLLSYNFAESKKANWFVSTGLSTYLMKTETYDYYYKDPGTGAPGWKSTTINNQNKHFFSIVNLSAGYERRLNNMLSVTAEPYIKVPVDGIGFGKIQLNSAGIALTLSIRPFTFMPKK